MQITIDLVFSIVYMIVPVHVDSDADAYVKDGLDRLKYSVRSILNYRFLFIRLSVLFRIFYDIFIIIR